MGELFELNESGYVKNRESFDLEFKTSFHSGDPLFEYIRSMVGMANNRGGRIVFGVDQVAEGSRKPLICRKSHQRNFNLIVELGCVHENVTKGWKMK